MSNQELDVSSSSNIDISFHPIHTAHAIEQVVFALQFASPLQGESFSALLENADRITADLPAHAILSQQGFMINPHSGVVPFQPNGIITGKAFQRVAPNGSIEKALRVEQNSLSFHTSIYTRWMDVWSAARQFFEPLAPLYAAQSQLTQIGLTYIDKFEWFGDLELCDPVVLLRPSSTYLSPNVYSAKDLWHSHTGAFTRTDSQTKRLLNVNVDYVDDNRPDGQLRRVVAITTALTDMLNQPSYEPADVTPDTCVSFVERHMQQLHIVNKEVLGSIITEKMNQRIALTN